MEINYLDKLLEQEEGKEVIIKFISTYKVTSDEVKALEEADQVAEKTGMRHEYGLVQINDALRMVLKIITIYKDV